MNESVRCRSIPQSDAEFHAPLLANATGGRAADAAAMKQFLRVVKKNQLTTCDPEGNHKSCHGKHRNG